MGFRRPDWFEGYYLYINKVLSQTFIFGFLQAGFKVAEVDASLFGCGNYFGYGCAVLHLMITPKQGAASTGAAESKNRSRRLLQQILEGCDIGCVDLRRDNGLG